MRRFWCKWLIFIVIASLSAALGHGFLRHVEALAAVSAFLALLLAQWRGERVWAPFYTAYDEAAWFLLVGRGLHAFD